MEFRSVDDPMLASGYRPDVMFNITDKQVEIMLMRQMGHYTRNL